MGVNPEEGGGKGGHVDETDAVGLAFDKVELDIFSVVYQDAIWGWWTKYGVACRQHLLHKWDALPMIPILLLDGCWSVLESGTYQSETVNTISSSYWPLYGSLGS